MNMLEISTLIKEHKLTKKIIDDNNIDVNMVNSGGRSLLHFAVIDKSDNIKLLLDNGAVIDRTDRNGWTPLYLAVDSKHIDVVKLLLSNGANPSIVSHKNHTPFTWAVANSNIEITEIMIPYITSLNKENSIIKEWLPDIIKSNLGDDSRWNRILNIVNKTMYGKGRK